MNKLILKERKEEKKLLEKKIKKTVEYSRGEVNCMKRLSPYCW